VIIIIIIFLIFRFIYCGKIDLAELQGPDVLKLLLIVNELQIQTLISCIQEYSTKHQNEFLRQNPIEVLEIVYRHEIFTDLWDFFLESICGEPAILFNSDKFISLKAPLLELLLKRDDSSLNETVIWDNLIKWCFAQHPSIQQDVKKWNKEEVKIMERTLHRFIPLIRFYYMPPKEFRLKVYPFKVLLPEDLVDNLLTFHMVPDEKLNIDIQPPRKSKFDSFIIGSPHFAMVASWIEKKDNYYYNTRNIPYSFNLLYRASRDGDTAEAFHARCNNKGATLVIVKVTEQLIGGIIHFLGTRIIHGSLQMIVLYFHLQIK
jgi:hypothetical protein